MDQVGFVVLNCILLALNLKPLKIKNLSNLKCLQIAVVLFTNPDFAISKGISYTFTVSNLQMPSLKG